VIAWADLLQALEGDVVHLPAPKNFCRRDLELSVDTPFFAMSDAPLVLIKRGSIDRTSTEMMNVRWKFFHFSRAIPQASQVKIEPCGYCFANKQHIFIQQTVIARVYCDIIIHCKSICN
jgi:hypothetical protein